MARIVEVACAVVAVWLVGAAVAWADPPSVTSARPRGLLPGKEVAVEFTGPGVGAATQLWCSLGLDSRLQAPAPAPGAQAAAPKQPAAPAKPETTTKPETAAKPETTAKPETPAKPDPNRVTFLVRVPPLAPPQPVVVRLVSPAGASPLVVLWIDPLPSQVETASNGSPAAAQKLVPPAAVDGACDAERSDYYAVAAEAGQRLVFEVLGRRLGSPVDPLLRLLDAEGRELASADDGDATGVDPVLEHTFAKAGTYLVEVRDIRYQGGPSYAYRLRIGGWPRVVATLPLAATRGSRLLATMLLADGRDATFSAALPEGPAPGAAWLPIETSEGRTAVRVLASDTVEQLEQEPNDGPEAASPVVLPGAIQGRFAAPRDRDYYRFTAKKGERWLFAGQTRALGFPTDLWLRVEGADGKTLAEIDDAGTDEGALDFTAPADGAYRLVVEDLNRRGGPALVYRLTATAARPGFSLALDRDKFDLPQGGVWAVKVTATRRDYAGPITLAVVEPAAADWQPSGQVIPQGKNETTLTVRVPPTVSAGQLLHARIEGRATIGDRTETAVASATAAVRTALGGGLVPPAELDGLLALGVGPPTSDFFQLKAVKPVVAHDPRTGPATFTLQLKRLNKFDDTVTLAVVGLPPGIEAQVTPIAKGKAEATVTLTAPPLAAEGDYSFRVVGSGTFNFQPREVTLAGLALRVVRPPQPAAGGAPATAPQPAAAPAAAAKP